MHGIAKRGLALAAAASGLVMGIGGAAYADATSIGGATNDHGIGAGQVVGGAAEAPILLCGTGAPVAATQNDIPGGMCAAAHTVQVGGNTSNSGGIVAGNVIQAGAAVPGEVCGTDALVGGADEQLDGTTCAIGANGPIASALGAASDDRGIASGNVVNLSAAVPLEVCGTNAAVVADDDHVHGTTCSIS